jgi:tight adherence protein B
MDTGLTLTLVVAFVAVVFGLEGLYMLWSNSRSPEVRRLQKRMQMVSTGGLSSQASDLVKARRGEQASGLGAWLARLPLLSVLDQFLAQAGLTISLVRMLTVSLAIFLGLLLALSVMGIPIQASFVMACASACLPWLWVALRRRSRVALLEAQFPEAVELIVRALKAGHAFSAALQMVVDECPDPLAAEFRTVQEQVNFGVGVDDALRAMSVRLPSDDVRFFVIAVLLQRETGGNLAEVLGNIAALMRDRANLLGKVRVLAAEGKLSAVILALMPIVIGALISLVNPGAMSLLWTDPVGLKMVYTCAVLYVMGGFWMWRIINIRV